MQQKPISAPSQGSGASRVGWWIVWVISIGLLAFLINAVPLISNAAQAIGILDQPPAVLPANPRVQA